MQGILRRLAALIRVAVGSLMQRWTPPPHRVLVLGLDAAGKTTLLYKLKTKHDDVADVFDGHHVYERLEHERFEFLSWDLGGACRAVPRWRPYLNSTRAVVFVVDASDPSRISEAADELRELFAYDEWRDAVLLVLANKQDRAGCLTPDDVAVQFKLANLAPNVVHVIRTSITQGVGVDDAIDWLNQTLSSKR